MVGGTGGDGGASQREAERQRTQGILDSEIRARFFQPNNTRKVGGTFTFDDDPALSEDRVAALSRLEDDVRSRFVPDFNELTDDATRELNFTLARRGLFGGSAETNARERLNRRIGQGEEDIAQRVIGARTAKESFDNDLLDSLLAQSAAGASSDTVLGNLSNRLSTNTSRALTDTANNAIISPFANVGSLFKTINDSSQFSAGQDASVARLAALIRGGVNNATRGTQGVVS